MWHIPNQGPTNLAAFLAKVCSEMLIQSMTLGSFLIHLHYYYFLGGEREGGCGSKVVHMICIKIASITPMCIRLNLRQLANIGCKDFNQFTGVFSSMDTELHTIVCTLHKVMFVMPIASTVLQRIRKVWHICFDLGRFFHGQTIRSGSLQPKHALVKYNFLSWNSFEVLTLPA